MDTINEDDFERLYRPRLTPEGQTTWTHAEASAQPLRNVWSLLDPGTGDLYAAAGYHLVNTIGFLVTEEPWVTGEEEAEWYVYEPSCLTCGEPMTPAAYAVNAVCLACARAAQRAVAGGR